MLGKTSGNRTDHLITAAKAQGHMIAHLAIHLFECDRDISKTNGWSGMKFGVRIFASQGKKPFDFGDLLPFLQCHFQTRLGIF